jgi:hypothetical protein
MYAGILMREEQWMEVLAGQVGERNGEGGGSRCAPHLGVARAIVDDERGLTGHGGGLNTGRSVSGGQGHCVPRRMV